MPNKMSKPELINLLLEEEYGQLPAATYTVIPEYENVDESFCAGKADLKKINLNCKGEWGEFRFPVYYVCPRKRNKPVPCFIHINFSDLIPDKYQPTEEIIDQGCATLTFYYEQVSSDSGDFTDGLAGVVYPHGKRKSKDCGKIGLWAWAAIRVLEYALTLPEIDHKKISVIGHSRLGKTALLAGALDERFYCAFSNNSGCSGAALARQTTGETIEDILSRFPFWFCENYKKYIGNEESMPFDQHFLLAANVPHKVYVASAEEDAWACPINEYMACVVASEYYVKHGLAGFVCPDRLPVINDIFHEGYIGFHLRGGSHYLSREDWKNYIEFLKGGL